MGGAVSHRTGQWTVTTPNGLILYRVDEVLRSLQRKADEIDELPCEVDDTAKPAVGQRIEVKLPNRRWMPGRVLAACLAKGSRCILLKWEHAAAEWMGVGVSQWREVPEGGATMAMIALHDTLERVTERRAVKRDRAVEALTTPLVALLWRSDDPIVDVDM